MKLFGTPAEETGIGKTYMLREGLFKDVDTILSWHAGDRTAASWDYSKAIVSVKFRFEGLPAHASTSPHQGRSALDAVELMNVGVNYMREHVKEDTRIHYVITNGGGQPNVVPPPPRSGITCAPTSTPTSRSTSCGCTEIARAAAAMSRTKLVETRVDSDMHEVLPNRTLVGSDPEEPRAGRPAEVRRPREGLRARDAEGSQAAAGAGAGRARRAAAAGPPHRDCTPPTSAT